MLVLDKKKMYLYKEKINFSIIYIDNNKDVETYFYLHKILNKNLKNCFFLTN